MRRELSAGPPLGGAHIVLFPLAKRAGFIDHVVAVGSMKWFVQSLEGRGIPVHRTNGARGFKGLRIGSVPKAPLLKAVGGVSDTR